MCCSGCLTCMCLTFLYLYLLSALDMFHMERHSGYTIIFPVIVINECSPGILVFSKPADFSPGHACVFHFLLCCSPEWTWLSTLFPFSWWSPPKCSVCSFMWRKFWSSSFLFLSHSAFHWATVRRTGGWVALISHSIVPFPNLQVNTGTDHLGGPLWGLQPGSVLPLLWLIRTTPQW